MAIAGMAAKMKAGQGKGQQAPVGLGGYSPQQGNLAPAGGGTLMSGLAHQWDEERKTERGDGGAGNDMLKYGNTGYYWADRMPGSYTSYDPKTGLHMTGVSEQTPTGPYGGGLYRSVYGY
jgi:hypothetical protein